MLKGVIIFLFIQAGVAWAECKLNGQVPIDFGNLDGLTDLHLTHSPPYVPGLTVTRSQHRSGVSAGLLYVGTATRGNGKDYNSISNHRFVFKDGTWQELTTEGDGEALVAIREPLPIVVFSEKNEKGAKARVIGFIKGNGNRLEVCPPIRRDSKKVEDIETNSEQVRKDQGKELLKTVQKSFSPDCSSAKISLWPREQTTSEYVVDVESKPSGNVTSIHIPREGEFRNELAKRSEKDLLLDLKTPSQFISDCKGVRKSASQATSAEEKRATR